MAAAPVTSDWSSLPRDPLMIIAEFTLRASVEDFMAFGGVCKSWREVGRDDEFVKSVKLSWPTVPFLMLPQKEGKKEREFFSISRRNICMSLPMPQAKEKRCIESRFGWLLTLACSPQNEGDVELLNPFSAARIPLPNYKTFPYFVDYKHDPDRRSPTFNFITRSVLSANPSTTSDFVLLVVLSTFHMAFWRNGDDHWTILTSDYGRFVDAIYSNRNRCFYALNTGGGIFLWDAAAAAAGADPPPLKLIHKLGRYIVRLSRWGAYLVESSAGELLVVARNGQVIKDFKKLIYGATEFRVYHVDVTTGDCKRVWSLKDDAIFVGHNAAISIKVQPNDAIIKSNRIYFSDDSIYSYGIRSPYRPNYFFSDSESDEEEEEAGGGGIIFPHEWDAGDIDAKGGGGKDMGIYNLEDASIQRFDHPHVDTLSFICPPLWIAPSSFSRRLC